MASVLLVDDDRAVLESLGRALASEGFAVRLACDAAAALREFAAAAPDIVLLDLNMPGRSGWDAFEEMSRWQPLVPVVIVTARPGQFLTAREACVAALVEKPVDIPALVETMRRLLRENQAVRLSRLTHRPPATLLVRPESQPATHDAPLA